MNKIAGSPIALVYHLSLSAEFNEKEESMLEYIGSFWSGAPINGPKEGCERKVKGILTDHTSTPCKDKKVKVFVKDWFGISHYVGKGKTDDKGMFTIKYNWTSGWASSNYRVVIAVIDKVSPFEQLKTAKKTVGLEVIERKVSVQQSKIDIGKYKLPEDYVHAESIEEGAKVERMPPEKIKALTKVQKPSRIPSPDYFRRFLAAVAPVAIKRGLSNLPGVSTKTAQAIFDTLSSKYDHYPNTPEALIDCLMNTVCSVPYKRDGDTVTWEANWDICPLTGNKVEFDKENSLPNVKVVAKIVDDKVICESIEIQFRDEASETFLMDSPKDDLERACYIAKSVFALKGELEEHLAKGHLLVGIDAEKFFKYITPENAIYKPLSPHLLAVDFINWAGSLGIIFDTGSVLEALTALTGNSLGELFVSGIVDRADYTQGEELVQKPLTKDHVKAIGEQVHLKILTLYVDYVIEQNIQEISKEENWKQIYRWSKSVNNRCSAIPKITESKTKPQDGDIERLRARMIRLLFLATIGHGIVHAGQAVLMNVFSASMGMENRALKNEAFAPDGNTNTSKAAYQLFIAWALMRFNTNKLIDNREGNVDPELLKLIDKHREEYPEGIREMIPQYVEI